MRGNNQNITVTIMRTSEEGTEIAPVTMLSWNVGLSCICRTWISHGGVGEDLRFLGCDVPLGATPTFRNNLAPWFSRDSPT